MREADLIAAFLEPFGPVGLDVLLGPGSDCAAVQPARGMRLVATTDAVVERVHFTLATFAPEDVGWKALAVNLSDLAAAGARPRWFLCALGVPKTPRAVQVARRMGRGMAVLAREQGIALIGGNVTAAREWSLTITALGEARRPLSRKGARPGDALVVVGLLGDAAAGLRALQGGRMPAAKPRRPGARTRSAELRGAALRAAISAQRTPRALVEQGLAAARFASASIDVSDGFLRDLGHLCAESFVGAEIECRALPLGTAARASPDGLDLALTGGEDYALLLAVPRRRLAGLRKLVDFAEVGRVVAGSGVSLFEDGALRPLPRATGFDHLAR